MDKPRDQVMVKDVIEILMDLFYPSKQDAKKIGDNTDIILEFDLEEIDITEMMMEIEIVLGIAISDEEIFLFTPDSWKDCGEKREKIVLTPTTLTELINTSLG